MNDRRFTVGLALLLVSLGVALRLLPHPANFAPVAAIALFGGAVLPRKLALWVPMVAMIVSDSVIGFYDMMPVTWVCYGLIALAGTAFLRELRTVHIAVVTMASSLFFFVVTNFAVWISSGMYDHTWAGLIQCYSLALPFFRNTLASDAVYTAMLFGVFITTRVAAHSVIRLNSQEL